MNFVAMEPCFYVSMATPAFYEYGMPQLYGCHGNNHVIFAQITASLIDKICCYASHMNEPPLN